MPVRVKYERGTTVLHALNPLTKLLALVLFSIGIFLIASVPVELLVFLSLVAVIAPGPVESSRLAAHLAVPAVLRRAAFRRAGDLQCGRDRIFHRSAGAVRHRRHRAWRARRPGPRAPFRLHHPGQRHFRLHHRPGRAGLRADQGGHTLPLRLHAGHRRAVHPRVRGGSRHGPLRPAGPGAGHRRPGPARADQLRPVSP